MKKYVKSDSNFFDTVEVGDVVGNVNSQEELDAVNNVKDTLRKYKLTNAVKHWRIGHLRDNNNIVVDVYFTTAYSATDYRARFNADGSCQNAWIAREGERELEARFLLIGQRLMDAIDGEGW